MDTKVSDGISDDDWAFLISTKAAAERISSAAAAVKKNPATASTADLVLYSQLQAHNNQRKAETIAGLGMHQVKKSTREHESVACRCIGCNETCDSVLTIPSSRVGNYGRKFLVYKVENGKKVGNPLRTLDNVKAADEIKADGRRVRTLVEGSEEGGILRAWGKRPEPLWLQYEPRRQNMIVAPTCKKKGCGNNTKPVDSNLRFRVDYALYNTVRNYLNK